MISIWLTITVIICPPRLVHGAWRVFFPSFIMTFAYLVSVFASTRRRGRRRPADPRDPRLGQRRDARLGALGDDLRLGRCSLVDGSQRFPCRATDRRGALPLRPLRRRRRETDRRTRRGTRTRRAPVRPLLDGPRRRTPRPRRRESWPIKITPTPPPSVSASPATSSTPPESSGDQSHHQQQRLPPLSGSPKRELACNGMRYPLGIFGVAPVQRSVAAKSRSGSTWHSREPNFRDGKRGPRRVRRDRPRPLPAARRDPHLRPPPLRRPRPANRRRSWGAREISRTPLPAIDSRSGVDDGTVHLRTRIIRRSPDASSITPTFVYDGRSRARANRVPARSSFARLADPQSPARDDDDRRPPRPRRRRRGFDAIS